jgi:hypothetical protein
MVANSQKKCFTLFLLTTDYSRPITLSVRIAHSAESLARPAFVKESLDTGNSGSTYEQESRGKSQIGFTSLTKTLALF